MRAAVVEPHFHDGPVLQAHLRAAQDCFPTLHHERWHGIKPATWWSGGWVLLRHDAFTWRAAPAGKLQVRQGATEQFHSAPAS